MNTYKLYLSGPISNGGTLSQGQQWCNAIQAMAIATDLSKGGIWVHVPHLTVLFDLMGGRSWEEWLGHDYPLVGLCDGILRLPGESKGANLEVKWAREAGKDIFYNVDAVKEFHDGWRKQND